MIRRRTAIPHVAALHVGIAGRSTLQVRVGRTNGAMFSSDFRTQARQALSNLQTALKGAGAGTTVAKLTVLIVDLAPEDKLRLLGRS